MAGARLASAVLLGLVRYFYNKRKWIDSMVADGTDGFSPAFLFRQGLEYDSSGRIMKQRWQHRGASQRMQVYIYGLNGGPRVRHGDGERIVWTATMRGAR